MNRPRKVLLLVAAGFAALVLGLPPQRASAQAPPGVAAWGDDYTVKSGEVVEGNVTLVGGDLTIEDGGSVTGDVAVAFGDADVNGTVAGQLFVGGGDLTLGPTAHVNDVRVIGEVDRDDAATVTGTVWAEGDALGADTAAESSESASAAETYARRGANALGTILFAMLFAALAVAVAPRAVGRVRLTLSARPWSATGVGCLAWILFPFVFVILLITIVGPLILSAAYAVALLFGWSALSLALGARIMSRARPWVSAAIGAAIVAFLLSVGGVFGPVVGCIMFFVWAFVSTAPLGAGLLTFLGSRPWPSGNDIPPSDGEAALPEPPAADGYPPAALPAAAGEGSGGAALGVGATAAAVGTELARDDDVAPEVPTAPGAAEAAEAAAAPDMPVAAVAPEAPAAPVPPAASAAAPASLTDVPGISPIYALLLRESGIRTVSDLAQASPEHVAEIVSTPGVTPVSPETAASWIARAAELGA